VGKWSARLQSGTSAITDETDKTQQAPRVVSVLSVNQLVRDESESSSVGFVSESPSPELSSDSAEILSVVDGRMLGITDKTDETATNAEHADWLGEARQAIDQRLTPGPTRSADIERLRNLKHRVLKDRPSSESADPLDDNTDSRHTGLSATLADQVEALTILIDAVRNQPIDRDRLATLTVREAWRLHRHDVIAAVLEGDPWPPAVKREHRD
jgi:hypothetical protein